MIIWNFDKLISISVIANISIAKSFPFGKSHPLSWGDERLPDLARISGHFDSANPFIILHKANVLAAIVNQHSMIRLNVLFSELRHL